MENLHVNYQFKFLTSVTNVFNNSVSQIKIITCKNEGPPWMNNEIICDCLNKSTVCRQYINMVAQVQIDHHKLQNLASHSANLSRNSKAKYLAGLGKKLNDPQIGCKADWSILYNSYVNKNIPLIPPVSVNDNFITNISLILPAVHLNFE